MQRRERNLSRGAGPNPTVLNPSRRRGHHESPWMHSCSEGCHSPLVAICNARVPVSVRGGIVAPQKTTAAWCRCETATRHAEGTCGTQTGQTQLSCCDRGHLQNAQGTRTNWVAEMKPKRSQETLPSADWLTDWWGPESFRSMTTSRAE